MNEEETKFEVFDIPEAIGLTFEDFDLVVEALEGASGNPVFKVGEDLRFVSKEDVGEFFEMTETTVLGSSDPGVEETASLSLGEAPEIAELLFKQVTTNEWFVHTNEFRQMLNGRLIELFSTFEK